MSDHDGSDPLTVLRADDVPVQPDHAFAERLRTRLQDAASAPANGGPDPNIRNLGVAGRTTAPRASAARTVTLRNVFAVAAAIALLAGVGWYWSVGHSEITASTTEYKSPVSDGIVGDTDTKTGSGRSVDEGRPAQPVPNAAPEAPPPPPTDATTVAPDIITTGSLSIVVAEPSQAADRLALAVKDAGGRVDSRSEQSGPSSPTVELVLRIPPDKVDTVLDDAKDVGEVESMSISHTDVTAQRVDLDARIKALQTSVNRLLQLMDRAGDVADLLAAESSLTQRQAELDSLNAQRAQLGDQIGYATISVSISAEPTVTPGGFTGAVGHGWQSLVSAVHGVVLAIGFLLPWIPVAAVVALAAVVVVRRHRKARQP